MCLFGGGGVADVFFKPYDTEDLAFFLKNKPKDIPHFILGVGSNVLIRDSGFKGVVIRPVSYTHLDVYKRQVLSTIIIEFR